MTDEQLAEIEAREKAATKGPWNIEQEFVYEGYYKLKIVGLNDFVIPSLEGIRGHDAQFIAHARTDIPRLLAAVYEQRAENKRLHGLELERSEHLKEMQRLGQEFDTDNQCPGRGLSDSLGAKLLACRDALEIMLRYPGIREYVGTNLHDHALATLTALKEPSHD